MIHSQEWGLIPTSQILELADKCLWTVIIIMPNGVRENMLLMNGKIGILSRKRETIRKNQMENTELKNKISEIEICWMGLAGESRWQRKESVNLKIEINRSIIQSEEHREKNMKRRKEQSLRDMLDNRKFEHIFNWSLRRRGENEQGRKDIWRNNGPKCPKSDDTHLQWR